MTRERRVVARHGLVHLGVCPPHILLALLPEEPASQRGRQARAFCGVRCGPWLAWPSPSWRLQLVVRRSPGALGSEDWTGRRPLASGAVWVPGPGRGSRRAMGFLLCGCSPPSPRPLCRWRWRAARRSLVIAGQWQAWGSRLSAVPTLVSLIVEGRKCEYRVVRVSVHVLAEV